MKYNKSYKQTCKELGKHLKKLREERNITLREMSDKTKIRLEYLKGLKKEKLTG